MTAHAAPDNLYLSPDQQDLLLAALTSNSSSSPMFTTPGLSHHLSRSVTQKQPSNQQAFGSPESQHTQATPPSTALSATFPADTPLMANEQEFPEWDSGFELDGSWDYDFGDGLVNGTQSTSPEATDNKANDSTDSSKSRPGPTQEHEKRKEPPEGSGNGDSEPKRRESDDKQAKKPGRKPLTSEPTSKRKAQNRAAQRAFRERKEKHLRDLEQKVTDLEKASESANHENSMLRAQVDRLQTELKEYRRRVHTAELAKGTTATFNSALNGFQFDFPPFGTTLRNGSTNSNKDKNGSQGGQTLMDKINSLAANAPSVNGSNSTDFLNGGDSSSLHSTPRLTTCSTSSPSVSSMSQHGPDSSCGTSPEPYNNSPTSSKPLNSITEEKTTSNGETYVCKSGSLDGETETTFCEKLGMACGNPNNPIPKAPQFNAGTPGSTSMDWLQNTSFDPVLFNDYRDPSEAPPGLGGSFFDDAFPNVNFNDIGSPLAGTTAAAPQKKDLLNEVDATNNMDDDDDEVVPADDPKQMLSCNKIWDRISSHPRFVSGELDMDGLCSELRAKAKCSEVGVVVAENDVQEVLGKVPGRQ